METNFCQKKFRSILLLPLVIALFKKYCNHNFCLICKKKKPKKLTNKQTNKKANKLKDLKTLEHFFFYLFLPF